MVVLFHVAGLQLWTGYTTELPNGLKASTTMELRHLFRQGPSGSMVSGEA